ncbi:hypothetical protein [Capnocytophaga canis]|uniref:hypothetical protein n=1 Tax=Capnocytophaga canis TaxID=1848903 RepID=UPI00156205C7|nr:hypothetical protein [Capnocytophaga canis]
MNNIYIRFLFFLLTYASIGRKPKRKVYIVDPTKESPNAFEEGTSLQVAAGVSYVGIY